MNNFIALTKVLLKTGLNMGSMNTKRKKNGKVKQPMSTTANIILSLVVCIPVALMMGGTGMGMYSSFAQMGQAAAGYELLANMGAVMVLVFSIPYVLSVFFMSSDLESLLPLPLKPNQIIGAKFTSVLVYEYLIIFMFYAPMLVGYGIAAQAGAVFWVMACLSILIVPITPLAYASFFAIILMRLLKNVKNKEMITTVGTFVMVFAIMIFSMSIGASSGRFVASEGDAAQLAGFGDKISSISRLGVIFPNNKLLAKALGDGDFLQFVLYLLTVAAFLGVFFLLSGKMYFKGVKGVRETSSHSGKAFTSDDLNASIRQGNPKQAFLRKEMKTLFRSPEYFTNCLMMPILFPAIMMISMCVPAFTAMKGEMGDASVKEIVNSIASGIPSEHVFPVVLLIVFVLAVVIAGSNFITGTCISREGKGFIYMKFIPMPYREQLEAKSWCGLLVSFLASLPYVLAVAIGSMVLFRLNISVVILSLLVDVFSLMVFNYIQLWFDLKSPKLNWENEQGAVRQNFTTAISMFAIFILGGIFAFGAFMLNKLLPVSNYMIAAIVIGVLAALAFLLRSIVLSYGEHKLNKLEG